MSGNSTEWTENTVHVAGTDLVFIRGGNWDPVARPA